MISLILFVARPALSKPPLLTGIGHYHRAVATKSALAQKYFDQGLALFYAFHKSTSTKYFQEAERLDPGCAMAYWGEALSYAPDINFPVVDEATSKKAIAATAKAVELAKKPEEKDLAAAMVGRYATPAPADRSALDAAYRKRMEALYRKYPKDPDVASLYAESILILSPWNQWKKDGAPQAGTLEALDVVKRTLKRSPSHLMANHLLIHILEGGPRAAEATGAADKLCSLAPSLGHLVHMPSHIYVRTGKWRQGIEQNRKAIISDRAFVREHGMPQTYLPYMVHNRMMLAYAGMMNGDYASARWALSDYGSLVPRAVQQRQAAVLDWTQAMPYDVEKRFGHWQKLVSMPEPPEPLFISRSIYHADRSVAFAALGDRERAEKEFDAFASERKRIPANYAFGNNDPKSVLDVYERFTTAELAIQRGDLKASVESLKSATAGEDQLGYDEPPDWLQPCRHTLGAVLVKLGRGEEARNVYLDDLRRKPGTAWSLLGMSQAWEASGDKKQAAVWLARYRKVWAKGTEAPPSSCACLNNRKR